MGSLSRWHAVEKDGVFASCDMVRYRLKFLPRTFKSLQSRLDTAMCDTAPDFWQSRKIGAYRMLWVFEAGESSISVGLGRNEPSGKIRQDCGFMEYNPNKASADSFTPWLLGKLVDEGVKFELSRWDLAIDLPIPRNEIALMKDARKYESIVKGSATEYLGERNKPGRVKVYDKAAESGLSEPVTRVELTCSGNWGLPEIERAWPSLLRLPIHENTDNLNRATAVMILLLSHMLNLGQPIESYLSMLDKRMKSQVRAILSHGNEITFPADLISKLLRSGVGFQL